MITAKTEYRRTKKQQDKLISSQLKPVLFSRVNTNWCTKYRLSKVLFRPLAYNRKTTTNAKLSAVCMLCVGVAIKFYRFFNFMHFSIPSDRSDFRKIAHPLHNTIPQNSTFPQSWFTLWSYEMKPIQCQTQFKELLGTIVLPRTRNQHMSEFSSSSWDGDSRHNTLLPDGVCGRKFSHTFDARGLTLFR